MMMQRFASRSATSHCSRTCFLASTVRNVRRVSATSYRHGARSFVVQAAPTGAWSVDNDNLVMTSYDDEGCKVAEASFDQKNPNGTVISIQVSDFPMLLRTIAWVFKGMEVQIKSADVRTIDENLADNSFLVTDLRGRKLSDKFAAELVDRIENIVVSCLPEPTLYGADQEEWRSGNLHISNLKHPKFTEVVVLGEPGHKGFVLDLTSVFSGIGAVIHEAIVRSDNEVGDIPEYIKYDFSAGRFFRFLITDRQGLKLNASRVSSLVFVFNLVTNRGALTPMAAPNLEIDVW